MEHPWTKLIRSNILDFGLILNFPFKPHIDYITKRTYASLDSLYRSIDCFTLDTRKRLATQLILPIIDYADIVNQNTSITNLKRQCCF